VGCANRGLVGVGVESAFVSVLYVCVFDKNYSGMKLTSMEGAFSNYYYFRRN
jgi:hypothetical protein